MVMSNLITIHKIYEDSKMGKANERRARPRNSGVSCPFLLYWKTFHCTYTSILVVTDYLLSIAIARGKLWNVLDHVPCAFVCACVALRNMPILQCGDNHDTRLHDHRATVGLAS